MQQGTCDWLPVAVLRPVFNLHVFQDITGYSGVHVIGFLWQR